MVAVISLPKAVSLASQQHSHLLNMVTTGL